MPKLHEDAPRAAARPRPPRRINVPNLSPTRPPQVEADQALWPWWTDIAVDHLPEEFYEDFNCEEGD